jgi:hypothetical protein
MEPLSMLEQLCFCTTRIETEDSNRNKYSGTGFFFDLNIDDKRVPLLITNKHVVEGMEKGEFRITMSDAEGQPLYTNHMTFIWEEGFSHEWIFHPDPNVDLCVLPIAAFLDGMQQQGGKPFFRCLSNTMIPAQADLESLDAIEEIVMMGYPNGLWDSVNNMPIARRGITATPVYLNYEGKREFVIDAACFPGSSGSPVLVCDVGGFRDKKGNLNWGNSRLIFLGILYGGPQLTVAGEIKIVTIPHVQQRAVSISSIPNNLGFIIKSECILDFIPIIKDRFNL